jgi:hypothetical protein
MAGLIDQITRLKDSLTKDSIANLAIRLGTADSIDGPNAEHTLSNTSLLLESLATFYGEPKSALFPTSITTAIRDRLTQAESIFAGLPAADQPVPADTASGLLKQLEELFVYCLQYGLMTYGFSGKIAQEQVESIQLARQQTKVASQKMLAALKGYESELTRRMDAFGKLLDQSEADCDAKVNEKVDALQPSIDKLVGLLAAAQSDSAEITKTLNIATENATEIGKLRTDIDATATTATAEFTARKSTADAEVEAIQAIGKNVQMLGADAKAKLQEVIETRATIKTQLAEVTAFYGEIEKHRSQMTEISKAAQSDLADLRKQSEDSIANFRNRTENIVNTNESLIDQIQNHLRKAIGASLFSAFDTRRRQITNASWIWALLLLTSVGGTIGFTIWFAIKFAELVKSDPSNLQWTVVYTRLVVVAPLAFLIAFTAKRYASERRAEEEWAFKSSISISLEPFRDLIARMKEKDQQTEFVERLVSEIFDNPNKRLYPESPTKEEKDKPDVLALLKDILDKLPKSS